MKNISKNQKTYDEFLSTYQVLKTDIQYLKGIGPKRAFLLKSYGIKTFYDFLYFFPVNYLDYTKIFKIKHAKRDNFANFIVYFKEVKEVRYYTRKIAQAIFYDETGEIVVKWFNYNIYYLKNFLKRGKLYFLSGKVSYFNFYKEMVHPHIEEADNFKKGIVPVYREFKNISQKVIRGAIKNLLDKIKGKNFEYIPNFILEKENLPNISECFLNLHFPDVNENIEKLRNFQSKWHIRLIFEEFFFLMLAIAKERLKKEEIITEPLEYKGFLIEKFLNLLPFKLTNAQRKVLREIYSDLKSKRIMNRLVQGDVGCGKTLVAFITSLMFIENQYQVAFMAPTEILAEQHFKNLKNLAKELDISIALLTGSTKKKEKDLIKKDLENGKINIVIGTHALIEENVKFKNLGLNIIDEQHKFGVKQRLSLKLKGEKVHTLIMTATPIPRTLTLTIYGDLDVSIIDELPPGRKPVKTFWFYEKQKDKYIPLIKKELEKGRQAYFIYPLVEESDKLDLKDVIKMKDELQNIFEKFKVEMLHGKMKPYEKEKIMEDFKNKKIDILASTTVIEVGVDVPNATVMVIENAERFGLAQLHQLRGRVGRGAYQSYCFLISSNRISDIAKERLKIMCQTNDGFKISEEDLKIRGPGEFLGTKQSGLPEFKFADIIRDYKVLLKAKDRAFELIKIDPEFEKFPELKKMFQDFFEEKTILVETG